MGPAAAPLHGKEVMEEVEYDTGPFCRHFSDPADCEITCQACGHVCRNHGYGPEECDDCECPSWVEEE